LTKRDDEEASSSSLPLGVDRRSQYKSDLLAETNFPLCTLLDS